MISTTPTTVSAWYADNATLPTHGGPGHTVVALRGDLDIASAPALREQLIATLRTSARLLILDLRAVSFCDAAGLAVLIGVQRRAAGLDITLRLVNPRPQVTKLLHVTGLDRSLIVHTPAREALRPSPPPAEVVSAQHPAAHTAG